VPEVREKLPSLPRLATVVDSEHARFLLFDAIGRFLKKAAESTALVLVLDDLHWADTGSLLLLEFVASELRDARVLIVGTYRDAEARQPGALADALAALSRLGRSLPIRGLGKPEVALFVERVCGTNPDATLVAALHDATDGNPFFLDEIARLLAAEASLPRKPHDLPLPESVRAVILRRLTLLPQETQRALAVASVIGREFESRVLERACDRDTSELVDCLTPAVAAGVVARSQGAIGRHAFAHALIRETLYDDLGVAERVDLHRRIGQVLEAAHRDDLEPQLATLAHHFGEAAVAGDAEKAIEYVTRAGHRAAENLAYEEAVQHFERALALHELRGKTDDLQIFDLLLALGRSRFGAGYYAQGRSALTAAAERARKLGDPERFAVATVDQRLAGVAPFGRVDERRVQALEEVLRVLPNDVTALRARALGQLAIELMFSTERTRAMPLAEESVRAARATGDDAVLAEALSAHAVVNDSPDIDPREALAQAREIVRHAEKAGLPVLSLRGRWLAVLRLLHLGEGEELDREIESLDRKAGETRHEALHNFSLDDRVMRATVLGQLDRAEALLAEFVPLRATSENATRQLGLLVFRLRFEQGRLGEIIENVEAGAERTASMPAYRCALAAAYAEMGREADARETLERMAARGFDDIPRDWAWLGALSHLAMTCAILDDTARAAILYERLRPYTARHVAPATSMYQGPVSHFLAILAATLARYDEAAQHFDDALTGEARMGARPWRARTQYAYAEMMLARGESGDREKALELVGEALATAKAIGMNGLAPRAERLQARLLSSSPALDSAPAPTRENVLRREGDYWTIFYEGRALRLKDTKGLRYLAELLRHPGREFHVVDLVGAGQERDETHASTVTGNSATTISFDLGDAGQLLDAQAKSTYRRRLQDLREEREEAERFNDRERVARAREEIEFLTDELARATGLGGRDRKAASAAERARQNVTMAIKATLRKLSANSPSLGRHLVATVRTGKFCSYTPDPASSVRWTP
jgi:tetratricopeptide (TPR) repeat protein